MEWFRLYTVFAHDPKLSAFSKGQRYDLVRLMCLACESEVPGTIYIDDDDAAAYLGIDIDEWTAFRDRLVQKEIIDVIRPKELRFINWSKRQYQSDTSTERVRRHREARRAGMCNVTETLLKRYSNVTETACNVTETACNAMKQPKTEIYPEDGARSDSSDEIDQDSDDNFVESVDIGILETPCNGDETLLKRYSNVTETLQKRYCNGTRTEQNRTESNNPPIPPQGGDSPRRSKARKTTWRDRLDEKPLAQFDWFYKLWPKKVAPDDAAHAWLQVTENRPLGRVVQTGILRAVEYYSTIEAEKIPGPAPWIRRRGWFEWISEDGKTLLRLGVVDPSANVTRVYQTLGAEDGL